MTSKPDIEIQLDRMLFASRWLLAPVYVGLVAALLMLVIVFLREVVHYVLTMFTLTSGNAIVAALTLIDLSLTANLLLIVLFSGYENFVARLYIGGARPNWMGKVDFTGLKMNLLASIVAISGISLLKYFMEISEGGDVVFDLVKLRWLVLTHLCFVVSGVLLALMSWLTVKAEKS